MASGSGRQWSEWNSQLLMIVPNRSAIALGQRSGDHLDVEQARAGDVIGDGVMTVAHQNRCRGGRTVIGWVANLRIRFRWAEPPGDMVHSPHPSSRSLAS